MVEFVEFDREEITGHRFIVSCAFVGEKWIFEKNRYSLEV